VPYVAHVHNCQSSQTKRVFRRACNTSPASSECIRLQVPWGLPVGRVRVGGVFAGADINKAVDVGLTPLYTASQYGNESVVRALIGAGADVNKAAVNVTNENTKLNELSIVFFFFKYVQNI
jgi:hypothetical protein